jgi:hypothetical protein
MTKELLKEVATMDLRDQLEAKEQMIKNYKDLLTLCYEHLDNQMSVIPLNIVIDKIKEVLK